MTYEMYRYIFYDGAILAGILFIISVVLFIVLKIPAVIGDLTGATERKAVEDIRKKNEITAEKTFKSSDVNRERGKLTDKISPSGNLIRNPSNGLGGGMKTEKISTQKLFVEENAGETTLLAGANETTVLYSKGQETTFLDTSVNAGMNTANETTLLTPEMDVSFSGFEIECEITFIHTQEVII